MSSVYLSLGTNLGNKEENLRLAIDKLNSRGIKVVKVSGFYNTKPYGKTDQPDFLNCAALAQTNLTPHELLKTTQKIEADMGRIRNERWGPRIVDIDILFYDDLIINTDDLIIPHPDLHNRKFVLEPMCEIAPDFVHPALKKDMKSLLCDVK